VLGFVDARRGPVNPWRLDACERRPVRVDCAATALRALEHGGLIHGLWGGVVVRTLGRRATLAELRAVVASVGRGGALSRPPRALQGP